ANDCDHAIADPLHGRCGRIGHRRAHASADHDHGAEFLNLRRLAQWADHVEDAVAGFQRIEQVGGLVDGLHHDVDRTLFWVGLLDGERNALAGFVDTDDHELPGPLLFGDARRFDHETLDSWRDELCIEDFEHRGLHEKPNVLSRGAVTRGCDGDHEPRCATHAVRLLSKGQQGSRTGRQYWRKW